MKIDMNFFNSKWMKKFMKKKSLKNNYLFFYFYYYKFIFIINKKLKFFYRKVIIIRGCTDTQFSDDGSKGWYFIAFSIFLFSIVKYTKNWCNEINQKLKFGEIQHY